MSSKSRPVILLVGPGPIEAEFLQVRCSVHKTDPVASQSSQRQREVSNSPLRLKAAGGGGGGGNAGGQAHGERLGEGTLHGR